MSKKQTSINTSYLFEEEDQRLALQVAGLSFSHRINPRPFAPIFHFHINETTTIQHIQAFLTSLSDIFELRYFRSFDQAKSVAGTMITVRKELRGYCFCPTSHGQDKTWTTIDEDYLLQELFTYRQYQPFKTVSISRHSKQPTLPN
jgi:hypothetical protein